MANQLQKFNGQITTGLDLDLLWSILQNTGGGGGFDISTLNKEDTQVLVSQILQSVVIAIQATNSQLDSNILREENAIANVTTAVNALKASNTTENGLVAKEATQLTVKSAVDLVTTAVNALKASNTTENGLVAKEATQLTVKSAVDLVTTAVNNLLSATAIINHYTVSSANLIVSNSGSNSANTYFGARKKMIVRVTAGTGITIVAGNPAGAVWQFWQNNNRNNLQTTLTGGVWVCDSVPNYFSIIVPAGASAEVTLYP
ncbi:MAG: hypothetical protein ACRCZ9_03155 [Fusobacteriaceae bacterium]